MASQQWSCETLVAGVGHVLNDAEDEGELMKQLQDSSFPCDCFRAFMLHSRYGALHDHNHHPYGKL